MITFIKRYFYFRYNRFYNANENIDFAKKTKNKWLRYLRRDNKNYWFDAIYCKGTNMPCRFPFYVFRKKLCRIKARNAYRGWNE